MQKIIIAGGGTGGHIFPAIAIANKLKERIPSVEILFIGANGKMEMEKVPQAGYRIEGLDIAGFNRSSILKNLSLPFKLAKSFWQVKQIIQSFKPDAVIGVGGYSTYPVLRYAQTKGIPSFIHESNSFAGKANMMLAKKAAKIFVATEGMDKFFPKSKIVITGNPVRNSIINKESDQNTALQYFKLDREKQTVLVIGGSLGAKSINDAILLGLEQLEKNGLQLIWQTGNKNAEVYKQACDGKQTIWVGEFIKEMGLAYAAADIVISRAGAMSVTELSLLGKAVIFVPYPLAAEDHQTVNASVLVNKKAALMVKDATAAEQLIPAIISLSADADLRNALRKNIRVMAIANADDIIVNEIISLF
ncbi:MAG: undecaprenyldiphospho-muramoylpentapeptide beta-N-acetylglucosaminyltransferase [Bacteroidota bacterium]